MFTKQTKENTIKIKKILDATLYKTQVSEGVFHSIKRCCDCKEDNQEKTFGATLKATLPSGEELNVSERFAFTTYSPLVPYGDYCLALGKLDSDGNFHLANLLQRKYKSDLIYLTTTQTVPQTEETNRVRLEVIPVKRTHLLKLIRKAYEKVYTGDGTLKPVVELAKKLTSSDNDFLHECQREGLDVRLNHEYDEFNKPVITALLLVNKQDIVSDLGYFYTIGNHDNKYTIRKYHHYKSILFSDFVPNDKKPVAA